VILTVAMPTVDSKHAQGCCCSIMSFTGIQSVVNMLLASHTR